jgi:UDP-GlcNAc:undecaprenyl-phosphate/decaprenyl-phosphate GlcNAc-1-phosphate transferase
VTFFHLELFAFSLFLSFVFTRYIRNWATSQGLVSAPAQGRHLHRTPLPRLGGVAIFLAFVASLVVGLLLNYRFPRLGLPVSTLLTILLPGTLIFLLGVYDDLHGTGPYCKFTVQALAAAMLFAGGLRILDLPMLFGDQHLPWWIGLPLTILWVLAITNAFNLIDGLDGLAAGSALFSTIVVFAAALFSQSGLVSAMAVALAGAILGFLRFNFNPATIFLGDCGSLFIGFMLSALALQGAQKAPTIIAVAIPVVSCGLPILETALFYPAPVH